MSVLSRRHGGIWASMGTSVSLNLNMSRYVLHFILWIGLSCENLQERMVCAFRSQAGDP